jgi:hypothetical protein
MVGLGIMTGPVIGSILYQNLGYSKTFMILSYILVINFLVLYVYMPEIANTNFDSDENKNGDAPILLKKRNGKIVEMDRNKQFGYMTILTCKGSLWALLGMVAAQTFSSFYEPVLSMRLSEF